MSSATLKGYTIFEVLELGGPVVAHHEIHGIIITINKVCFSSWTCIGNGLFVGGNTCLIANVKKVGDCTDFKLVVEAGQDWIVEVLAEEAAEKSSNN